MRLTKKSGYHYYSYGVKEKENKNGLKRQYGKSITKLGQLEDVEDELGIDLVTLFKALKQGGVYVKNGITEDTAIKMRSFQICGDNSGITIWSQIRLNAEDYGKTWALTKEELL